MGLASACTNTLYQGKLEVLNSQGKSQQALLYWSKTEKLIGDGKAGPLMLSTACSTRRIHFVDSPEGIVFRGISGQDHVSGTAGPLAEGTQCGIIKNAATIAELAEGPLNLTIRCEAVMDDFAVMQGPYSPYYIAARTESYQFVIQESSAWSLFGTLLEAPQPPECTTP